MSKKLTEKEVSQILKEYRPYVNGFRKLAKKYGVTYQNIHHIIKGNSWANLQ